MATTSNMRSFNDVMSKPNTQKFISLRLEVRTYVKSTPSEWKIGVNYKAGQLVKISSPIERQFRCLEEHISNISNSPELLSSMGRNDLWLEVEPNDSNNNNFTTAGINYGDWLVDNSLEIRQDDIDTSSSINYNSQQNVSRTLTLNIKNTIDPITLKGLQNWGADFANNRQKWWLDKRLAVFIQVRLLNRRDAEYWEMPMGVFIITGLSSTHTLTNYPITTIQASSAEVLYSSRRGKFDKNVTYERGITIIDAIKRTLIQGGEKPENIMISPDVVGDTTSSYIKEWETGYHYTFGNYVQVVEYDRNDPTAVLSIRFFKCIEEHTSSPTTNPTNGMDRNLYWIETSNGNLANQDYRTIIDVNKNNWTSDSPPNISILEDRTSYRTKYSSTSFLCNNLDQIDNFPKKLATYTFKDSNNNIAPIDFSQWNTAAFYARSDMDLYDGTMQIWFYNGVKVNGNWIQSGEPFKLNIKELVGNVSQTRVSSSNGIVTEQSEDRENWRMMIIPLGFINELDSIYKMELVLNKPVGKIGYEYFKIWLDDIIVSKVNNVLQNPLNYTISQNRWQAVKEMADLMLCDAYYTRDGYFLLTKQQLLSPTTYIDNIREYLKWSPGFGPFNTNPNPTINKIPPFNLIETDTIFQFEPFYNFRTWLLDGNRTGPANILKISTNNLYSLNLVQPNTYYGDFIINIGLIWSTDQARATRIINHLNLGPNTGYFPKGMFHFENGSSITNISINQIIKANLIQLLYFNTQNKTGNYNYWALDDLFGLTGTAALIVDRSEFEAVFIIDKAGNYQVPQDPPVITFSDLQEDWRLQADYTRKTEDKRDAFYAGGTSTFDEGEISNHTIAYGGYENDPIMGKAEAILTEDGLNLKVKGKYINERGRVRGINDMDAPAWQLAENYMLTWAPAWLGSQFYFRDTFVKHLDQRTQVYEFYRCIKEHISTTESEPGTGKEWNKYWKKSVTGVILNKDTDIDRLYAGCFNIDIVREVLGQDKFLHLTEQPVSNFTVEKIGDYIYQHNQGQSDSLLKWTWELMNRVIFELKKHLSYSQKFSFQIKPYYGLDCHDIIKIHDRLLDIVGTGLEKGTGERFKIETISIPLNGNYMSITATREYKANIGIPAFDQSHKVRYGPYFYGIDVLGDNNIDYRESARQGKQVLYDTKRLNVGGGSNVPPYPQNVDAPDNNKYPGINYAHFFTQRYPLKNKWGTSTWIPDKEEDGITMHKVSTSTPEIGKPFITYEKDAIRLTFPSKLYAFDGSEITSVSYFGNLFTTIPANLIKKIIYNETNRIMEITPNANLVNGDFLKLNPNILFIKDANGRLMTLSTFEMKYNGKTFQITDETIDIGIYMPGNPGKVPGYTIEDIERHMGYSTSENWYPSPAFGLGGKDWMDGVQYRVGEIVRIPCKRKWSTLESYIFLKCKKEHLSSIDNMPKYNPDYDPSDPNSSPLIPAINIVDPDIPSGTVFTDSTDGQSVKDYTIGALGSKRISLNFIIYAMNHSIVCTKFAILINGTPTSNISIKGSGISRDGPYFGKTNSSGDTQVDIGIFANVGDVIGVRTYMNAGHSPHIVSLKLEYNISETLWEIYDTDGISWIIGQPISLTYDFYDLSFFEAEMSLEKGYAATPVTNGEAIWELMKADDNDLLYSYRWMYKNGKLIYSKGLETGFSNKNMSTRISNTKQQNLNISSEINNILKEINLPKEEIQVEVIENGDYVTVEAPNIDGYKLDQQQNMFTYDPNSKPEYIVKYTKQPKGTIVVRHVWNFNGKEIDIIEQQIFSNVYEKNIRAISSNKWSLITKENVYNITIDEDNQIKTFIFEYKPFFDWIITNNFHNLPIEPMLIDEYNIPFLSNENPIYISNVNNFCWMENDKIYITGAPKLKVNYIIFSNIDTLNNSLASISVKYKNGIFGHFFSPENFLFIKKYEQKYNYIEIDKVNRVCGFRFSYDEPAKIFIL